MLLRFNLDGVATQQRVQEIITQLRIDWWVSVHIQPNLSDAGEFNSVETENRGLELREFRTMDCLVMRSLNYIVQP